MESSRTRNWVYWVLLCLYVVVRLLLIPKQPELTFGFRHDGAYMVIVARNLLSGKGFVLDSIWLVFNNPPALPMSFRNANPLFPILIALVSRISGHVLVWSSFAIAAFSSALMFVAAYWLLRLFVAERWKAYVAAFFIILLPDVWSMSWMGLTDELWAALMIFSIAFLLRTEKTRNTALAGLFFGLAWLTRSLAMVAIPSVVLFLGLKLGWKTGLRKFAVFAVFALVVSLPWIIRNARLGSSASDDNPKVEAIWAYYVTGRDTATRGFHSPTEPLPMSTLIRQHPVAITERVLAGLPPLLHNFLWASSGASRLGVGLFLCLCAAALAALRWPATLKSPHVLPLLLYLLLLFGLLSVAGQWAETRYYLAIDVLIGCCLLWSLQQQPAGARRQLYAGLLVAFFGLVVFRADIKNAIYFRTVDPAQVSYFRQSAHAGAATNYAPMVVGYYPYNYTFVTGAQSLAIPQSDDQFLVSYMHRYHACHVFLRDDELDFWRPQWRNQLPPGFTLMRRDGDSVLYRLDDSSCP